MTVPPSRKTAMALEPVPSIVPKFVTLPALPKISTPIPALSINPPVEPLCPLVTLPPDSRRMPTLPVPVVLIVPELATVQA